MLDNTQYKRIRMLNRECGESLDELKDQPSMTPSVCKMLEQKSDEIASLLMKKIHESADDIKKQENGQPLDIRVSDSYKQEVADFLDIYISVDTRLMPSNNRQVQAFVTARQALLEAAIEHLDYRPLPGAQR